MKLKSTRFASLIFAASLLLVGPLSAAEQSIKLIVSAGRHDRSSTPARVLVSLPNELAGVTAVELQDEHGNRLPGQLAAPSLLTEPTKTDEGQVARELHFVLPSLAAGKTLALSANISTDTLPERKFQWTDTQGRYAELSLAGRPVLRYMYEALDESSPARREETYKVFHHVFDPTGTALVTKGPGGRYTHHRGLFYGFNRVSYTTANGANKSADIWHCKNAHQAHHGFQSLDEGPVLGRHRVDVGWHGPGGELFAQEQREMSVYDVAGGTLIEFASRLKSNVESIQLDGDPQHAGFHFRASNEVADKTSKQTYYLRPDGTGKPGETRNWPGQKEHVNLPWNAMSFVLGDRRYTCCYLDRPENPKEARFSERDYGRFGSYFEYELTGDNTLDLNYRIWLQEGEMTSEPIQTLHRDFVTPPTIAADP